MADNTRLISSLPELGTLSDDDVLFCMRGSVSYKLPGSVVRALALGGSAYIGYVNGVAYWYVYDQTTKSHVRSEQARGPEGPRITNVSVDANYHLIVTLSDGSEYDAGNVRGPSGSGTGDMLEEDYDPTGEVKRAGGIAAFVQESDAAVITEIETKYGTLTARTRGHIVIVSGTLKNMYGVSFSFSLKNMPAFMNFDDAILPAAVYAESSQYAAAEVIFDAGGGVTMYLKKELNDSEYVDIALTYPTA